MVDLPSIFEGLSVLESVGELELVWGAKVEIYGLVLIVKGADFVHWMADILHRFAHMPTKVLAYQAPAPNNLLELALRCQEGFGLVTHLDELGVDS